MITIDNFKEALYYLHLSELQEVCVRLHLCSKGRKAKLIERIFTFIERGKIIEVVPLPTVSRADLKKSYPLELNTLILFGSYKNDLKTRLFFKKVVGDHFHFTAFGIDWINDRWLKGDPPTYGEFAKFWQLEFERRQRERTMPKQEWAYINFVQSFLTKNPKANRKQILSAWEEQRKKSCFIVNSFLE